MTMVIENQNRQYGGMSFDSVYSHNVPHHSLPGSHAPPQFTDPWASAHTSSHSTPPVYATSMGINHTKPEEVSRPTLSMPYSSIPVSAPSMVTSSSYTTAPSNYSGAEVMGLQHDMPRTTFEQTPTYTTAPSMSSFTPATYAPISYAPSLAHPHHDNRRVSHV
jgi:hypothetical protein